VRKHVAITAFLTGVAVLAAAWLQLNKSDKPVIKVAEGHSSKGRLILPKLPIAKQTYEAMPSVEQIVPAAYDRDPMNVGVPWGIERAMIGESGASVSRLREFGSVETQPISPQSVPQSDPARAIDFNTPGSALNSK